MAPHVSLVDFLRHGWIFVFALNQPTRMPLLSTTRRSSSFADLIPTCLILLQAKPPPRMKPSRGARGQPTSTKSIRTPLPKLRELPTMLALPTLKRWASAVEILIEAPPRLASPAAAANIPSSQVVAVFLIRSFELRSAR